MDVSFLRVYAFVGGFQRKTQATPPIPSKTADPSTWELLPRGIGHARRRLRRGRRRSRSSQRRRVDSGAGDVLTAFDGLQAGPKDLGCSGSSCCSAGFQEEVRPTRCSPHVKLGVALQPRFLKRFIFAKLLRASFGHTVPSPTRT